MLLASSTKISDAMKSSNLHLLLKVCSSKHQTCLHSWTASLIKDNEHPVKRGAVFWKEIQKKAWLTSWSEINITIAQGIIPICSDQRTFWVKNYIFHVNCVIWINLWLLCSGFIIAMPERNRHIQGSKSGASRIMKTVETLLNTRVLRSSTYFRLFMPDVSLLTALWYWRKVRF